MRLSTVVLGLAACGPVKGDPPGDGPPGDGPGEPDRQLVVESRATPIRNVDVLFVVDDSNTMITKQATLAANFQSFISTLETIPGGLPDLHLGVITTDMGTLGSGSPNPGPPVGQAGNGQCANRGKNGALQLGMATNVTGSFISDIKQGDGSRMVNYTGASLAVTFGNMASVGSGGCGFEQPLHAMRTALSPGANAGFLRADALLAVVFLSDEDDCSIASSALYDPSGAATATFGALNSFRCTRFGVTCTTGGATPADMNTDGAKSGCAASTDPTGPLEPVAPFHDFLVGLKSDPNQVVVAGIIGPPTPVGVSLVVPPVGGPAQPTLDHSCTLVGNDPPPFADPGVRLQSFFDLFPNRSASTSICQNSFAEALEGTANLIAQTAGTPCIGKPLLDVDTTTAGLQADCVVEDSLGANITIIQPCDASSTPTCWRLASDPVTCPLFDQVRLEVVRDGAVPAQTITRARCVVAE